MCPIPPLSTYMHKYGNFVYFSSLSPLSFLSSRPNWDPPPPHPQASVYPPPPMWFQGKGTLACGKGWGVGPNFNEGTDNVVLKALVLCEFIAQRRLLYLLCVRMIIEPVTYLRLAAPTTYSYAKQPANVRHTTHLSTSSFKYPTCI